MLAGKRILVITYYWPPSAGSGVQRWLKFSKYLPLYGYDPVIFTPENPDFDLRDPSLEEEVPKNLEVLKFPIWEPYQLLRTFQRNKSQNPALILEKSEKSFLDKIAIWIRANMMIPDPRAYWVKPSLAYLAQIVENNKFQAVITTGPPHSMHLIGMGIKEKFGIPWLADFRDPWSTWEFLDTLPMMPWAKRKHATLERKVFLKADAVCTISPTFQKEMQVLAKRDIHLLYNGFDREDKPKNFDDLQPDGGALHIVYSGVVDAIRDPKPFLEAMQLTFGNFKGKVKLTFVGRVSESIQQWVRGDSWMSEHVVFAGYVSHQEVFDFYGKANLLLLILTSTKNAKGNIPGKIFEYMATKRQIIALGDPEGDSANILHQAGAGMVFSHQDRDGMCAFLKKVENQPLHINPKNLDTFDRKTLTGNLAGILDGIQ
ncbi:glycosyltransferase family 4 protein [Pleomorphovibrio marinus]|uniref:glycosyltransferase family 4 protein n=1 Tax=Pleomorphovibrio marinus TaxID=2164132 RepID=UPI000E0BA69A|nr:glycosyltransferase family 4 protein [Pleomorphovibrio marinus]